MSRFNPLFTFSILFILTLFGSSAQAQFYWVGGSGNWSDFENHWATSSGGDTFHTAVPTSSDDVYFDENSFTAADQEVLLDASFGNCRNFDCSAVLNNPTFTTPQDLNIYGSAAFSGQASYVLDDVAVNFGDGVSTFTTNGAVFENCLIEFNNNSGNGTLDLAGDLTCTTFRFFKGTFNTNGYAINASNQFYVGTGGIKVLNLGDSEITCDRWRTSGNNLTINPGTSTIFLNEMSADEDGNGPFTYNNLTFLEGNGQLYNSGNFNVINASATAGHELEFDDGSTIECNDFILIASRQEDTWMHEGYLGTGTVNLIVNSGSIDLYYVRLQGIHASGGATFNVDPGVDLGNNLGWNFINIAPFSYYWVGDGGNWSDLAHWSSTSGGDADYSELPSRYDDVFFDGNSFSDDDQTIVLDYDAVMHDFDCSEMTNPLLLTTVGGGDDLRLHGNLNMSDLVNKDLNKIYFFGNETSTINTGTQGTIGSLIMENDVVYEFLSDVSCGFFRTNGSSVHTNDHTIVCNNDFKLQNDNTFTHELGASEIFCRDFEVSNLTINLNSGTSTIHVEDEFTGSGHTYHHVVLMNEEVGNLIEDSNTFEILEFAPGVNCELEAGTTQFANEIRINGTGTQPIILRSDEVGVQATLSQSTGTVNATFVSLQDNNATGGAMFNALQAVDFGNNTGWNITELQPNDFYWVGGSGNWSDHENHWATSSGGDSFYTYVPGVIDNVYFDENSFGETGQEVLVDMDNINCNTMDWTGVSNNPHLSGEDRSLNVFGSLIFATEMTADLGIYNFLGESINSIVPGFENSPGMDSELNFQSSGVWNINGGLTASDLNLIEGTINTNDHYLDIKGDTKFQDVAEKTLNLGSSTLNTRDFKSENAFADNFTMNGENSTIICRRVFSPYSNLGENNVFVLNDLHFELDETPDKFIVACTLNNLTLDPGVVLRIDGDDIITVNQLTAQGSSGMLIEIRSIVEGTQASIFQETGTVDGEYLLLKDLIGTGGATFTANNSIDNGNVTGWNFTGQAQSISFIAIDAVLEDVGSFNLEASATSGLPIVFNVLDGPATIDGNTITITGPGTVEVEAIQQGNEDFNPAAPIEQEFCSNPIQPVVTSEIQELFVTLSSNSEVGNNWYWNGELLGVYDQTFQTTDNGEFSVQIIIDGCSSELSEEHSVVGLFIDEGAITESILAYPNPSSGLFSFTLPGADKAQVSLFNASGKLVYFDASSTPFNGKTSIDISSLVSGIYYLHIQSESGIYMTKVFKEN